MELEREIKELTHSPHPNLKVLAAQNIRYLFNDFPELEEEAINAVYDLCEDQEPKVRIEGYTAITHLSNADHRLVRRNADVLLQLLQSDEVDEVNVVKKALTEHLDMDPKVTLSVLCDQIPPLDDSVNEEEQMIRDRLRFVVVKFLTGEAKRAIVERHALPGTEAEETLIDSLFSVLPKLGFNDVQTIVKELLISLKAFKAPHPRGHALLQILLNKVSEYLQKGIRSGDQSSLHAAQPYLDLACSLVVEHRAAPAIQLLRFYSSSLSTKMILQKFSKDDQKLIVSRLAETLAAANKHHQSEDDGPSLDVLRRQIVDSCPFLLEVPQTKYIVDATGKPDIYIGHDPERNFKGTVARCSQPNQGSQWASSRFIRLYPTSSSLFGQSLLPPPPRAENTTTTATATAPSARTPQVKAEEQDSAPSSSTPQRNGTTTNGLPEALQDRPSGSYPARRMQIASNSRPQERFRIQGMATASDRPSTQAPMPPQKHQLAPEISARPPKRQKSGGAGAGADDGMHWEAGPTLLSRLGTNPGRSAAAPANNGLVTPVPRGAAPRMSGVGAGQRPSSVEWSIKGAATATAAGLGNVGVRSAASTSMATPQNSLLERLGSGVTSLEEDRGGWRNARQSYRRS
ncbi:hypothetical protein H0H81_007747 [Sphagnurus paluster]|uniref:Apoptosis inhibitor 5 n=1 Tax=Sphagnurus paluster TaxID=117069 RepID=A0A9P7K3A5_9AGAR|nr:hypothetical protein H0H81_007747 [Sphagnurus paluster]